MPRVRSRKPIEERFWSKVNKTETCWLWTRQTDFSGYGHFKFSTKIDKRAHRVSYELKFGKIPEGLCVLHKCDMPACVNPDHLFIGTRKENNFDRGLKKRSFNSKKTNCKRGHPFDSINTRIDRLGRRQCKACEQVHKHNFFKRKASLINS